MLPYLRSFFVAPPRLPLPERLQPAFAHRPTAQRLAAGEVLALLAEEPGPEPRIDQLATSQADFQRLARHLRGADPATRRELVDCFEAIGTTFQPAFAQPRVGRVFNHLLGVGTGQLAQSVRPLRQAADEGLFFVDQTEYPHVSELERVTDSLIQFPAAERQPLMDAIRSLSPLQPLDVLDLTAVMELIPAPERAELAELLQPWAASSELTDIGFTLAHTPQEDRAQHADNLRLHGRHAPIGAPRVLEHTHRENVMTAAQMAWTKDAIGKLREAVQPQLRFETALEQIKAELDALGKQRPTDATEGLFRTRGPQGTTELEHARRTLFAPVRAGDYSEPVKRNSSYRIGSDDAIGVGTLCGLVWEYACRFEAPGKTKEQNAQEQQLIRHAVINALAQCIEDDGHRVCDVGITQRLTKLLSGRLPGLKPEPPVTPGELLAAFGLSFNHQLKQEGREANAEDVKDLRDRALAQGSKVYAQEPELQSRFERDVHAFLAMTYRDLLAPPSESAPPQGDVAAADAAARTGARSG
jgi:hypothetical protein